MEGTVIMTLEEYETLKDRVSTLQSLEDNLTELILDELNSEIEQIKNGTTKKSWFNIRSIYIKDLCKSVGYMALYDLKKEEAEAIKVEDSGNLE